MKFWKSHPKASFEKRLFECRVSQTRVILKTWDVFRDRLYPSPQRNGSVIYSKEKVDPMNNRFNNKAERSFCSESLKSGKLP
ncbi:hypothetical protein LEP1GSC070_1658 [Leptospira santarosai str. AIM]|nr:hypothetical protein LEP1GSC070_1658 [Leptospira santarosai str. AIM]